MFGSKIQRPLQVILHIHKKKKVITGKKNKKIRNRDGSVTELTRAQIVTATSELDINGDFVFDAGFFDTNENGAFFCRKTKSAVSEISNP